MFWYFCLVIERIKVNLFKKKKKGKNGRQEKKNENKIKGKVNLFPKRERKKGKKRKTEKPK